MNAASWTDFGQKFLSIMFGIIGTWLAVHTYYEKRHQDAEKRHQETLDRHALAETKAYAAQRDFEHLNRNQEQMKESLRMLDDEINEIRADSKELKGMMMVYCKLPGESISGIFGHKEKRE